MSGATTMTKNIRRRKGAPYLAHGSEGRVEIGQRVISDPLEPGQQYTAIVNVRESSIDHMHSRGRIDAAQNEAGQRFRKLWERAAVGRNQAMDTTKETVDGGGFVDPISDELVRAGIELNRVMNALGPVGSKLLIAVVGEGKRIEDTAKDWSRRGGVVRGDRAEGYITGRMVEALDELVSFWKLESDPIVKREVKRSYWRNGEEVKVVDAIRVSGEGHIGPATEISIGRFGDVVEDQRRGIDRAAMTPHTSGTGK